MEPLTPEQIARAKKYCADNAPSDSDMLRILSAGLIDFAGDIALSRGAETEDDFANLSSDFVFTIIAKGLARQKRTPEKLDALVELVKAECVKASFKAPATMSASVSFCDEASYAALSAQVKQALPPDVANSLHMVGLNAASVAMGILPFPVCQVPFMSESTGQVDGYLLGLQWNKLNKRERAAAQRLIAALESRESISSERRPGQPA
ncbi:MAG: hypothetical protein ACRC2U_04560 [Aeromonas sp.]